MSEHASGNAVYIGTVAFADRAPLAIAERTGSAPEARFQAAVRAGACAYFTTVIGPGSDAAHAAHLHFDMAQRSGGYRICDLGTATAEVRPAANAKRE